METNNERNNMKTIFLQRQHKDSNLCCSIGSIELLS